MTKWTTMYKSADRNSIVCTSECQHTPQTIVYYKSQVWYLQNIQNGVNKSHDSTLINRLTDIFQSLI